LHFAKENISLLLNSKKMTTIELNAVREEIANEILTEKNEILLLQIVHFIRTAKQSVQQPPCQFSIEELKAEILKSEEDFENGCYVSMEYMRAKHARV